MSDRRWGDTTSKKGEVSRVFVGNLDSSVVCDDLENKFKRYGKISGIDINSNGFGFIQFDSVDDAKRAVQNEVGTMLKGRKLECRMFDKSGSKKNNNSNNNRRDRSRSPVNNRRGGHNQQNNNNNHHQQHQPFDNHHNNHPYNNSSRGGGGIDHLSNGPMFGQPQMAGGPSVPGQQQAPAPQVNDVEIIVISKDQWAFAEMVERKIRQETGIKFIDILFLHSPQHISMTLNDLFERRTLYAVVIAPENEEHHSMTVHVLHNQMEFRNIPVDKAVGLISEDYQKFTFSSGGQQPSSSSVAGHLMAGLVAGPSSSSSLVSGLPTRDPHRNGTTSSNHNNNSMTTPQLAASLVPSGHHVDSGKRGGLPEEVAYVLRTTLSEGGVQFLSLQQIDSVINYFSLERDRMTAASSGSSVSNNNMSSRTSSVPQLQASLAPPPIVPSGYPSNYPNSSSLYGPGIGQQSNHQQQPSLHMDKVVPDVLKLVQESDVLQKLLAGVMPGGGGQSNNSNNSSGQVNNAGYGMSNNSSNHGPMGGLNASRRGPGHGGSGIGGADRGYGGRF